VNRGGWHPKLTTWVDRVDARWHQLGLDATQRRQLRLELVADLSQARLDGAPLDELLAVDPDRFAADVAVGVGFDPPPDGSGDVAAPQRAAREPAAWRLVIADGASVARVAGAGLFGSVVGGVCGLALLLPAIGWVQNDRRMSYHTQGAVMLVIYATAALLAALGGALAVASDCTERSARRVVRRRAFIGLIVSGIAATLVTVSFASATGYSNAAPVVVTELGMVIGVCALGLCLVAMSIRRSRHG